MDNTLEQPMYGNKFYFEDDKKKNFALFEDFPENFPFEKPSVYKSTFNSAVDTLKIQSGNSFEASSSDRYYCQFIESWQRWTVTVKGTYKYSVEEHKITFTPSECKVEFEIPNPEYDSALEKSDLKEKALVEWESPMFTWVTKNVSSLSIRATMTMKKPVTFNIYVKLANLQPDGKDEECWELLIQHSLADLALRKELNKVKENVSAISEPWTAGQHTILHPDQTFGCSYGDSYMTVETGMEFLEYSARVTLKGTWLFDPAAQTITLSITSVSCHKDDEHMTEEDILSVTPVKEVTTPYFSFESRHLVSWHAVWDTGKLLQVVPFMQG